MEKQRNVDLIALEELTPVRACVCAYVLELDIWFNEQNPSI